MTDPRFPILTQTQILTLKEFGTIVTFQEETFIFKVGDQDCDFYVVLDGEISLKGPNNEDLKERHGINEFTGDNSMLSNRSIPFSALASSGTTVLKIASKALKEVISKYSGVGDVLLGAFLHRQEFILKEFIGGIKIIGSERSKETYLLRDFLEKNHIWHSFLNTDLSDQARELLQSFNFSDNDLPVVLNMSGEVFKKPTMAQLAKLTGVLIEFDEIIYDVLVVGAGPAGLAASVYAASEGLSVVTIDGNAPGGQAGKSSKIENYLGFPIGISGNELANKAYMQAQKFGCNISIPRKALKMEYNGDFFTLYASNEKNIRAKTVIAATGAEYRRLPLENTKKFEGNGVFYSATGMNTSACKNELIGIVGGGNSAGQAALFLADYAFQVHVIIRGNDLRDKMSDYLVQRIYTKSNIIVHTDSNITQLNGSHYLESIVLNTLGKTNSIKISNLFTFIGAKPCTEWLTGAVSMDEKGFIFTGNDIGESDLFECPIFRNRKPQTLEGSIPGFFAVGDVRKGSVKRMASAVGEGSMAVSQIHQYLATFKDLI